MVEDGDVVADLSFWDTSKEGCSAFEDICRFHGDETRVAATQNITPVCVNDRIEVRLPTLSPYSTS
eukprot:2566224-Amphidinium_carterae.1